MPDLPKLTQILEYLFLKELVKGLKDKSFTVADAKKLAHTFLTIEPFASLDDAFKKMENFAKNNSKFESLKKYVYAYEEEQKTEAKIVKMKKLIRENKIDEALEVAKN